jgi:hypothetical protein
MQKVLKLIFGIMVMGVISIQSVFAQAICPDFTALLVDCTDNTEEVCFNERVSITTFSGDDDFVLSNLSLVNLAEEGAITLQTDSANFVVFGASTLSLLDEPFATLNVTLNARGRLRSTPNSTNDLNVVSAVDAGNSLVAYGRNERGDWVRVLFEDDVAWVATAVLNRAEFNNLPIVADDAPAPAQPLSNFVINTQSPCAGMLIQTTIDTPIEFTINNLTLSLGSTALINATEEIFSLTLLEGVATLSVDEESVPLLLVEGTQAVVNITDTLGEVVSPEPLSPSALSAITTLPMAITPAPPVPSQNIAQAVTQTFAPNGIANGRWRGVVNSRVGGDSVCRELRPQDVYVSSIFGMANGIDWGGGIVYVPSGANTFVFVDNRDWGGGSTSSFDATITVESSSLIQESITYTHTRDGQTSTCRYQIRWSYIGR